MDLDPDEVTHSGRLGPGQMLVVDLEQHKVYEDEALLELFDSGATYAKLVEDTPLLAGELAEAGCGCAGRGAEGIRLYARRREDDSAADGCGGQGRGVVDGR